MPITNIFQIILTAFIGLKEMCVIIFVIISGVGAIILASPIFILRLIVSHLSFFRFDLHKIIDSLSTTFAIDNIYTDPKAITINCSVYRGNVNIDEFRKLIIEKVVNIRKSDDGEVKNTKLKQYPYQWMGFMFWKWEENFDISEHVYYYDIQENSDGFKVSRQHFLEIESELLTKPFQDGKSPWEIIIIRNFECDSDENHFVILFRMHHCICDVISVIKNFTIPLSSNDGVKLETFMPTPKETFKQPRLKKYLTTLKMIILLPYQAAKVIIELHDNNCWKQLGSKLKNKYILSMSERISLKLLKEIAERYNVGLTAVIYSGFTAGIREAMIKHHGEVPEYIHCVIPFPIHGHSDILTNHFSSVRLKLPVGETDPRKRLRLIQESLHKFKTSLIPLVPFYVANLVGSIFPALMKLFLDIHPTTASGSSFPGPKEKYSILGCDAVDLHNSVGSCFGHAPVIFATFSYADGVRMKLAVNRGILDNQMDVDNIQTTIQTEYLLLNNYGE